MGWVVVRGGKSEGQKLREEVEGKRSIRKVEGKCPLSDRIEGRKGGKKQKSESSGGGERGKTFRSKQYMKKEKRSLRHNWDGQNGGGGAHFESGGEWCELKENIERGGVDGHIVGKRPRSSRFFRYL